MKLKDGTSEEYETYKKNNSKDPYSARVFTFGDEWASLMDARLATGEELTKEMMDETAKKADTDGITGYMYGAAASAIVHFWEHGEKFQVVFNSQYMTKEKAEALAKEKPGATVNPAIVTVG